MIDLNGHTLAELLEFMAGFAGLLIAFNFCVKFSDNTNNIDDLGEKQ